jgi:hypothetical protein
MKVKFNAYAKLILKLTQNDVYYQRKIDLKAVTKWKVKLMQNKVLILTNKINIKLTKNKV